MKHLVIVGRPRIGKTTLMKRLTHALRGRAIDGFLTEEVREGDQRVGFWLSSLDGRQVLLAHKQLQTGERIGAYGVNGAVLADVAVPIIQRAVQRAVVLFLDELGRMEMVSQAFQRAVQQAFDEGPCIVATVGVSPMPFVDAIKRRRDVELIPLTTSNRGAVEEELSARLEALCTEDEAVRNLQQQAMHICDMIVSGEAAQIDIEIQQTVLRERVHQISPQHEGLYELIYESRFRRLWQQFRHG